MKEQKSYSQLAIILRQKILSEDEIILEPIKLVEGYYNEDYQIFIDKNGYSYDHFSLLRLGNSFCYLNNIGSLMYKYKNFTYNELKKELLREIKKYKVSITREGEKVFLHLITSYMNEKPKFDFYNKLLEEIKEFIDMELYSHDDSLDKDNNDELEVDLNNIKIESLDEEIKNTEEIQEEQINISELYNKIKEHIIGQDDAVKAILSVIWNNCNSNLIANNILLIGPTGVGKTAILRLIAKEIGVPITIVNTNDYTQNGFIGKDVREILNSLIRNANGDIKAAERGIIALDEFDKIKNNGNSCGHIVNDLAIQQELLKLTEDGSFDVKYNNQLFTINTKNITFIALGAFSNIKELDTKPLGFNKKLNDITDKNNYKDITPQDIVKYGFIPELIGRFPVLIKLNDLSEKDFYDIILKSKSSTFLNKIAFLKEYGIDTEYSEELIKEIAIAAHKLGFGGRSLNIIISYIMNEIDFEVAINKGKYKKLILNKNIVNDNHDYKLS